jgi:hypothetical protein
MHNASTALVAWLVALLTFSLLEWTAISNDLFNTYFFVVAQLPLYGLVLFGCYALCSIGYHLYVLEDCTAAQKELQREIVEARRELSSKGLKFD